MSERKRLKVPAEDAIDVVLAPTTKVAKRLLEAKDFSNFGLTWIASAAENLEIASMALEMLLKGNLDIYDLDLVIVHTPHEAVSTKAWQAIKERFDLKKQDYPFGLSDIALHTKNDRIRTEVQEFLPPNVRYGKGVVVVCPTA